MDRDRVRRWRSGRAGAGVEGSEVQFGQGGGRRWFRAVAPTRRLARGRVHGVSSRLVERQWGVVIEECWWEGFGCRCYLFVDLRESIQRRIVGRCLYDLRVMLCYMT